MRHARTIVAAALLAAIVPAGVARAAGPGANPPGMKRLSDERTLSRWAYPNNHARVRSQPTGHARTVATLHWLTEDNLPEIYLVLASWRDSHGNTWVKIRVPKRPNGVTGWVPRRALRQYTSVSTFLDLNRSSLRLTLYRSGKEVMSAHVGIGSGAQPDAARALLRPREVPRLWRAGLRSLRVGHERLRPAPDRLAGGRRRRPAWHQRAGPHPRPPVARLHPPAQREGHAPVPPRPARDADPHPRLRRSAASSAVACGVRRRECRLPEPTRVLAKR